MKLFDKQYQNWICHKRSRNRRFDMWRFFGAYKDKTQNKHSIFLCTFIIYFDIIRARDKDEISFI